ncbi:alpha/beta fold hydrolase [Lentisalinibacter orientalis]|uniref:alpha/beta fold hydrolase n=1 Tax=Lentisalinibacter orientalis TaxID=2992241 RepID=UPI003867DA47
MIYRSTFPFFLALLPIAFFSIENIHADEVMRGTSTDDWQGWGVLSGGKGYADTPLGQVHYRDIGPRDYEYPFVLLHMTPMSMIQFGEVQNSLAELGVRSIAIDTPGYGSSDRPPHQPTIREYSDNLLYVLDHLDVRKVIVAGHHTGAQIATAFAASNPDRVAGIILHGAAILTAEESADFMKRMSNAPPRTPVVDGSHLTRAFERPMRSQEQAILDGKTWLAITTFIQGPDIGHWAAFHYDMEPDLRSIDVPGLILTDIEDIIHYTDVRASKVRPDFEFVKFSDGNILELMAQHERWASIAAGFAERIRRNRSEQ